MNNEEMLPTLNLDTYIPPLMRSDENLEPAMRSLVTSERQSVAENNDRMQQMRQQQIAGLERMKQPGAMTFLPGVSS